MSKDLKVLTGTMTTEIAYEGLKATGYFERLPELNERWEITPTREIVQMVSETPSGVMREVIKDGMAKAHQRWQNQPEVMAMMREERFGGYLNCFAELGLAGPTPSLAWSWRIYKLLKPLGGDFYQDFPKGKDPDYAQQFDWLTGIDCMIPPMFKMIFLDRRKEFAENIKPAGVGELYKYVIDPVNDVLRLAVQPGDRPEVLEQKRLNRPLLYTDSGANIAFRLVRLCIKANDGIPTVW